MDLKARLASTPSLWPSL